MTRCSLSLTEGLREMIASGRLTEAMIPDDFRWLEAALGFAEPPSPPAPFVITEGSLKRNLNDPPVTPRPPAPRSQVASLDRSIDDLLGEALRRHRHGLIRPLWADMPDGELKQRWRVAGAGLLMADDQRHSAEGLLREAAMKTLSVRTAIEVLRKGWLASAEYAALFATDDPQTPEQWRAFGGVEIMRACAGELDPENADRFEPSELAKARAAIGTMREALLSASEFIAEELENRDSAGGDESDYVNDAKCALALVSDAIALSRNVIPESSIAESRA